MSGIFGTLNVANKGLMASQTGLHTTGHNISNANTEGYSRQRVDVKADLAFNYAGVGQLGTGVKMESVVRMVDDYVTKQIREENGTLHHFSSKAEVLEQLEIIFNEPSDTSLNFNIGEMFDAWQELSKNPELPVSKTIVVEKSKTLADTFNHIMSQMESLEEETNGLIEQNVKNANAIIEKLETLNKQIFNISVKDQIPNDLLDQRDLLLKDLSAITNFDVDFDKYERVSIGIGGSGEGADKWNILEAGKAAKELKFEAADAAEGAKINIGDEDIIKSIDSGEIMGRLDALDDLQDRKEELGKFGITLARAINKAHEPGASIFGYSNGELWINQAIKDDSSLIVAGDNANSPEGDGSRALAISRLRNTKLVFSEDPSFTSPIENDPNGNTIGGYYNEMVTNVGISKEHADNTVANQDLLLGQLELRREAASGVNIDEEVTDLIKFNTAYSANARVISTLTQMLDTLIGMGA